MSNLVGGVSIVKVWGQPEGDQPAWPCNRTFEEVDMLHEWNNETSLRLEHPNTGNLEHCVRDGEIMADLGCGDGTFAAQFKSRRPNVQVIAAGTHALNPKNIKKIGRVYYGRIPQQTRLLEDFQGQVELATETYGPATYYKKPLHVVNYALYLLKPQGTYSCISSTTRDGTAHSVFGSREHFELIKRFYIEKFGSNISLIDTKIRSRVSEGKVVDDCLLRLRFKGHNYVGKGDFETLCQQVDEEIGIPSIRKREWFVADQKFSIVEKVWPKDPMNQALSEEEKWQQ